MTGPLVRTLACLVAAAPVLAQAPRLPAEAGVGVIVVAHGGGPEWNAGVFSAVRAASLSQPVEVAFLMGPAAAQHRFQDAVTRLRAAGASRAVVVPLFVSSRSGHVDQIRWLMGLTEQLDTTMHHHLHMSGIERPKDRMPLTLASALDDAPELVEALAARAETIRPSKASRTALMLVGHGPNLEAEYAYWMDHLRRVATGVKAATGFTDVRVGLVKDDAPAGERAEAVRNVRDLVELQAGMSRDSVTVVPVLLAPGKLTKVGLPRDLANLPVRYTGEPLLPHPALGRWIARRVREATPGSTVGGL